MKASELPKSRRVLLLVDFLNPLDFPKGSDLAPHALKAARATAALKKALGADGVPAIYANDNFGQWRSDFPALATGLAQGRGASAQMARLLRPTRSDLSVLKPRHSAFYGTPLDILLDMIGAREVIVTGIAADICVQITATDAFLRGYRIKVPANCIAAESEPAKAQALEHMGRVLRCDTRPG